MRILTCIINVRILSQRGVEINNKFLQNFIESFFNKFYLGVFMVLFNFPTLMACFVKINKIL